MYPFMLWGLFCKKQSNITCWQAILCDKVMKLLGILWFLQGIPCFGSPGKALGIWTNYKNQRHTHPPSGCPSLGYSPPLPGNIHPPFSVSPTHGWLCDVVVILTCWWSVGTEFTRRSLFLLYIFTGVCHSVHVWGGVCLSAVHTPRAGTRPRQPHPHSQRRSLQQTVHILREFFLVCYLISLIRWFFKFKIEKTPAC